jgi:hypothetical protein
MKFMLLCYDDEQKWERAGKPALESAMREAAALTHELAANGQYVLASPLHAAKMASSVRVREGKRLVTDGPYAETREVLGGFYIIDVKDRNEAVAIAARHPGAKFGGVEVRPILEVEGLPNS